MIAITTNTVSRAVAGLIKRIEDPSQALTDIGALLVSNMRGVFDSRGNSIGHHWPPPRHRVGEPLKEYGRLRDSITPRVEANAVIVGTNYAPTGAPSGATIAMVHQFGATIRPRKAKALALPLTAAAKLSGGPRRYPGKLSLRWKSGARAGVLVDDSGVAQFALKKEVVIPPRPFFPLDGVPRDWRDEIIALLNSHLIQ
jgi:phage gpG-like protein